MQCRVCMKTKCNILIDMRVANTDEGQTLFDYFNYCTQLHASASDSFPKTLCKTCTRKLRIAYSFRKCALESNVMFEKLLALQKIKKQSSVNSTMDSEDYTDDPLKIEFSEALKVVKQPDREQLLVENGWNELSNLEDEYVYGSPLINEPIEVEQSQMSCYNDSNQAQMHIIDAYEESSLAGVEECETDTVKYIERDLQKHRKIRDNKFNLLNKLDKRSNTSLRLYTKCVKQKHEKEKENTSTSGCDMPYDDQTQLKRYINSERNSLNTEIDETDRIEIEIATNRTQCLYCKQIYSCDVELQDHVKRHLFKCPFCSKICTDVNRYYRHITGLHKCSEIEFPATQAVMEDVEINKDKRIYCRACNVTYSTIAAYRRHLPRKHDSENSDAAMPGYDIQTVKYKVCCAQKEVHGTISYVEESNHYRISENAADEKSIPINIYTQCDRNTTLSSEDNLQEKVDNHNLKEKGKYLCSFCPRVLSSKRAVEIHEGKQHLNIEPDLKECSFCQKKFNKVYLRKHIENVHIGDRKYKCDICGNMYKSNDNVMRHRLLHTKDRNYPCTVCDKRFTEKSELKVHMRLHTGEKPFGCHLCDRRFRIRVHLTYHLQQHARIKHKCNVCGKEFKHGKSLRNHLYLHTDVMPYRCSVCGYGSVKRDYFVKHMLHKHDKTMSVDELFAIFQANTGRSPYVKVVDDFDMNNENTQEMVTSN